MTTRGRKRRYCSNCKKVGYPSRYDCDMDAHYLCNRCDWAYVNWQGPGRFWVDDFLRSYAARKCKSKAI